MSIAEFVNSLNEWQLQECIDQAKAKLKNIENEQKVILWEFIVDNYVEEYFKTFEGACKHSIEMIEKLDNLDDRYKEFRINTNYFRLSEVEELGAKP